MTEVTLVKRVYILGLIALIALGVSACTRDKPEEPTPTLIAQAATPQATPPAATTVISPSSPVTGTVVVTPTTPVSVPPTATPVPATPQPPPSAPGTYTVKWGDWLNKIAGDHGVTVQAILAANPGLHPNLIYPGQVINIPSSSAPAPTTAPAPPSSPPPTNPSTYTVQRGEWIYSIARKFNVPVSALLAANPGINPNFLFPGQVLNIPGGTAPGANTPTPPGSGSPYVVKPGDTLFSIAVRFRTTTYDLQIKNNLANPHFIYPGQVLQIP